MTNNNKIVNTIVVFAIDTLLLIMFVASLTLLFVEQSPTGITKKLKLFQAKCVLRALSLSIFKI